MIFCNRQMDIFVRKFIGLRFDKETEEGRIRIYCWQVLPEKGILADENTDNYNIFIAVSAQGIAAVRLSDITFILVYRDQVIIFFR